MDSDDYNSLKTKLMQTAYGTSERITILDARDKLLRNSRTRQTDLSTAVAVVGTCPDMCPEYERYFRVDTSQVSPLEMGPNREPNFDAMIKEYRRSGADQEEPLPNELRPPHVLMRTFDYLCTNIMDNIENIGDWYDFVWSRTRAIRKDITQQHLCDDTAVILTEKCARFHIHCAGVMCEEDSKIFDSRINDENLVNCIQSLKDFYYDLSQRNVICPNEPEFRSYDILLHLTDAGYIQRELKHYKRRIRESPEVSFAIEAFYSYEWNNYIKFFNLIRKTSYLSSCILHRYFNFTRVRAFEVLRRAYTSNSDALVPYPCDALTSQLGFDSADDLRSFCEIIGLKYNTVSILLKRGNNNITDLSPKRSKLLIESKRMCSIGETINGGPLPKNPYKMFPLHNSFDENGRLKKDAYDAMDQQGKSNRMKMGGLSSDNLVESTQLRYTHPSFENKESPFRFSAQLNQISQRKHIFPDTTINEEIYNDIFNELTDSVIMSAVKESIIAYISFILSCDIIDEVINEMIRDNVHHFMHNEYAVNKKRIEEKRVKNMAIISVAAHEIRNEIIESFVINEVKLITNHFHKKLTAYLIEMQTQILVYDLTEEITALMIKQIVYEIINDEIQQREQKINVMMNKRALRLQRIYFKKWRNICLKRKRHEYHRMSFPALPQYHHQPPVNKENLPFLEIEPQMEKAKSQINMALCSSKIIARTNAAPFNIIDIVEDPLCLNCESIPINWKLAIYCDSNEHSNWIRAKIFSSDSSDNSNFKTVICRSLHVNVCIKAFLDIKDLSEISYADILGIYGVLAFSTISCLTLTVANVYRLLKQKPRNPPLPVMFMVINDNTNANEIDIRNHINSIVEDLCKNDGQLIGLSGDTCISLIKNLTLMSTKVESALNWLALKRPNFYDLNLTQKSLREMIEETVEYYFNRIRSLNYAFPLLHISLLCRCYNSLLDCLISDLTSDELQEISYPPIELIENLDVNWNSSKRFSEIRNQINRIKMPETESDLSDSESDAIIWSLANVITDNVKQILKYKNQLFHTQITLITNSFDIDKSVELMRVSISYLIDTEFKEQNNYLICRFKNRDIYGELPLCWRSLMAIKSKSELKRKHSFDSGSTDGTFHKQKSLLSLSPLENKRICDDEENSKIITEIQQKLFEEKTESQLLTKRLQMAIKSPPKSLPMTPKKMLASVGVIDHCEIEGSDNEDVQNNKFNVTLDESPEVKMERLQRMIQEERSVNDIYISTLSSFASLFDEENDDF